MMSGVPTSGFPAALDGVVVVELSARIGGAVCASLLAQLGATVIAVEMPSRFSEFDKSGHRDQLLADKLSFAPDIASEDDRSLLARLLAGADIVLTSSDFDQPAVTALLPRRSAHQIFCDITAAGSNGPLSGQALTDTEIQALVGIVHTTGHDGGPPAPVSLPLLEYLAGLHAAGATLAALFTVQQGGPGQGVEVALYDAGFAAMSSFLTRNIADGNATPTERIGNRHSLSAPWNVYRAADGWIQICTGSDVQWRRLCELMGKSELTDDSRYQTSAGRVANVGEVDAIVQAWLHELPVDDCVSALGAANIPGGPIAPIDRYPREANLLHRNMILTSEPEGSGKPFYLPGSPLKMSRTPGRTAGRIPSVDADRASVIALAARQRKPNESGTTPAAPLSGIRVLEIGHYTTAPVATRYLASLGADVIKIEPPEGEASRAWPPLQSGQSLFYTLSNSDKRDVTLDLTTLAGKACLRALLKDTDVLVENLKPGTLEKRGFSPHELETINPRLVYCAISGFGSDSLYAGRPAFDTVVQAMSGLMDLIKTDETPLKTGISIADLAGASMAVVAILASLSSRMQDGHGQSIDLSMQDILSWSTQLAWNGSKADSVSWRVIPCTDGYALSASAEDSGGAPCSRAAYLAKSASRGIRAVAVNAPHEALIAEQTRARALCLELRDARGVWPAFATPFRLLGTPTQVNRPAPPLGGHNEAIIGQYLDAHHRDRQQSVRTSHIKSA